MYFSNFSFVFLKPLLEMVVSSNDTQNVVLHDIGINLLLCTSCLRISIWNILK